MLSLQKLYIKLLFCLILSQIANTACLDFEEIPQISCTYISGKSIDSKRLCVSIKDELLNMRSVNEDDMDTVLSLYTDPVVREKYGNGKPLEDAAVRSLLYDSWLPRLEAREPFVPLVIFAAKDLPLRDHTYAKLGEAIGLIGLGYDDAPGEAQYFILTFQRFWGMGYGSRAVKMLFECYIPEIISKGFKLKGKEELKFINATARLDNPASFKILDKYYTKDSTIVEKYGALRYYYHIPIEALISKQHYHSV